MTVRPLPALALLALLTWGQSALARPAEWAQPVPGTTLHNLYRVDARLYRSEQPDSAQMRALYKLGIRDILNLREFHSDDDKARGTALRLHRVSMNAIHITADEVIKALRVITHAKGPVLVHCMNGADRTGTVVAMYRIVVQHWTREQALDELEHGGYGYHVIFFNIPHFIRDADIQAIARAVEAP